MQPDHHRQFPDPTSDREEAQPERVGLATHHPCGHQPAPDRIEQPAHRRMNEQVELVGDKRVASQAIGNAVVLEVCNPVLWISPFNTVVGHLLGADVAVSESDVGGGSPGQDLGLVDRTPRALPAPGMTSRSPGQPDVCPGLDDLGHGRLQQRCAYRLEADIRRKPEGIDDVLGITLGVERWAGKAFVGS